ncbi:carbamoyl transferase, partial [bacterium]|nr:carbamoyl transferase [bacterium]
MIILGINCVYHESSAALLLDGKLSFFVEEERINRIKHGKPSKVNNPHLLPMNAISECLKFANITLDDVDFIGFSFDNGGRLQNIGVDTCTEPGEWGTKEGEETFHSLLVQIPAILQGLGKKPLGKRFKWVPHHISHSAGAFLCSPFENALIFAIDGIGEFDSLMMCEGSVNSIKPFYTLPYPHSLGFLWEKISKFLGFSEYDCCKVMGLSSYGDPSRFKNEFQKLAFWVEESGFFVDLEFAQFRCSQFGNLEKLFGPCRRENEKIEERHSDIAAALQNFTQEAVIRLCRLGKKRANSKTLCLAGGVALNCVMNGFLERSEEFNQIYVQPSANDAGTALGAALYIWNIEQSRERNFVLDHTYWGPEYSTKEIESVLVQRGFRYKCLDDPSKT